MSKSVTAGAYTLVATPTTGKGTFDVAASCPPRPIKQVITYDANDHVTSVDEETEALAPSGRVIRRTVRDSATNVVTEDVKAAAPTTTPT